MSPFLKYAAIAASALLSIMAAPAAAETMDEIAEAYVRLVLEYGTHEPGYVDAYYGPAEWQAAAEAAPRSLGELEDAAQRLRRETLGLAYPTGRLERKRLYFMAAQLRAVEARIAMRRGREYSFVEEAELLFGVTPDLPALGSFAEVHARIAELVPGDGPLWQRIDALGRQYDVPEDALPQVMRAAIDRCRTETERHISLPETERFTLEFVTDKPWSGYNYYKGDARSLIQVNTDLPVKISRAVDLGCHEGYPGHHTLNALLEDRLVRQRGWAEFQVYPLYSPLSLIAEGTANAGIEMAFPGGLKTQFEADVLYPIAGLDPATAQRLEALNDALAELTSARYTIADAYLAGRMSRDDAAAALQEVQLLSPERAEQSMKFVDTYRSYIVNYGLGLDMVNAYLARVPGGRPEKWAAFERLISEPTLPADLLE